MGVLYHKEIIEFLIFPDFIGIQALVEAYGTVSAIQPLFVPLVHHAPDYAHSRYHCPYSEAILMLQPACYANACSMLPILSKSLASSAEL